MTGKRVPALVKGGGANKRWDPDHLEHVEVQPRSGRTSGHGPVPTRPDIANSENVYAMALRKLYKERTLLTGLVVL